ncbi:uncharacterized protein PRCAT00002489001 [Priceomyces carsonii]|uniref:uncharacterized protein n=1 Tax=Priceomyces carsonii TaxID=28549 RepID=UPI002EDB6EE5|nr:unnamed protein product [Priceomyces carsonii]
MSNKGKLEELDKKYNVRPLETPSASKLDLEPLVLKDIDLSLFEDGDSFLKQRKRLAGILEESITTYGFFNVTKFGFPEDKIEKLKSISQSILELPWEEKLKYLASAPRKEDEKEGQIGGERGQGFKPKGYWLIKGGVRDSIDHYNFQDSCHDEFLAQHDKHPELLAAHLSDFVEYFNHLHRVVFPKLLRLCDLILDVPEGTLLNNYFKNGGTNLDSSKSHARLMMYYPYNNENFSEKTENTFLRGHSDISAFTFITSQPVLGLQVKDVFSGKWRYVAHREQSLIVNIGDAMEFISGGYFKACLHRVIEPPKDQVQFKRLVLIYFCNPEADSELDPELIHSKKLDLLGYNKSSRLREWEKILFQDWNTAKGKLLGRTDAGERNLLKYFGRQIERWHHFEKPLEQSY